VSSRNQLRKFAAAQPSDEAVRASAHEHQPQLVVSRELHGEGILDHVADFVSALIGSMYLFVAVSLGVVFWLFAGNIALNEMNKRQLQILEDQNRILALLQSRALAT
jgi:hypothetical protein